MFAEDGSWSGARCGAIGNSNGRRKVDRLAGDLDADAVDVKGAGYRVIRRSNDFAHDVSWFKERIPFFRCPAQECFSQRLTSRAGSVPGTDSRVRVHCGRRQDIRRCTDLPGLVEGRVQQGVCGSTQVREHQRRHGLHQLSRRSGSWAVTRRGRICRYTTRRIRRSAPTPTKRATYELL